MSKIANFFLASPENNYRPPVLSYKAFLIYAVLLLLLRLFLGALPTHGSAIESNTLMRLINEERGNRNLSTLLTNQSLLVAANQKSQDMIDRDYFAHVDPDGNYIWPKIVAAGYYPYKILGENLAVDFSTSEGLIKAWIDSPSHRANLLHPDFVDQGLAALYGDFQGRYTNLTASLFGALAKTTKPQPQVKAETPPPSAPQPTPPPHTPSPPKPTPPPTPTTTTPEPITTTSTSPIPPRFSESTNTTTPTPTFGGFAVPQEIFLQNLNSAYGLSRIIFTLFGILLLIVLAFDSMIIHRQKIIIARPPSSYHLFSFMLIVLVSILIWWW